MSSVFIIAAICSMIGYIVGEHRGYAVGSIEVATLKRVVAAVEGHDFQRLLKHAEMMKQSDGEGWAIGEMVERAVALLEASQ